ncbi:MAG: L-serine ammonia-lyase, iron-sulfur-dependent subunit beta [Lachnospiraceae bacterium]|nr:L-serine ammonia-lyase, iron-sulfur-dependent subunit beta [Lachnospiraceae bacterium]
MNVFDIIGPVMVGPSSSHTAGAVRIGRVVNKLCDGHDPVKAEITLSGSFAKTGKGHGTDKALLAGIMGFHSYSPEVKDALNIAKDRGLDYSFTNEDIRGAHPNTARISFVTADGKSGEVLASSIGGGNIIVSRVNGMKVDFNGSSNTILVMHTDKPGVIANVTNMMHWEYEDLNISNFSLSRQEKGGEAIMTIETDNLPPEALIEDIRKIDHVTNAILIRRL